MPAPRSHDATRPPASAPPVPPASAAGRRSRTAPPRRGRPEKPIPVPLALVILIACILAANLAAAFFRGDAGGGDLAPGDRDRPAVEQPFGGAESAVEGGGAGSRPMGAPGGAAPGDRPAT